MGVTYDYKEYNREQPDNMFCQRGCNLAIKNKWEWLTRRVEWWPQWTAFPQKRWKKLAKQN